MCQHCDALDVTDFLIDLLNKLLETEFEWANEYAYADKMFPEES